MRIRIRTAARTDVGKKRDHNEDAYLCAAEDGVFVLADGVGGAAAGEVASAIAIETVREAFVAARSGTLDDRLRTALITAHERIVARASSDPALQGMGAAVVAVAFDAADGRLAIGNVGDARGYRLRAGVAEQLSEDHTLVQQLLAQGRIQRDDIPTLPHRHVLTQALGASEAVVPTVRLEAAQAGDTIVLCSDGIHDLVTGEEIAKAVVESGGDLDAACERLVAMALDRGGHDNATIMVLACELAPARPSAPVPTDEPTIRERSQPRRPRSARDDEPRRNMVPWLIGAGAVAVLVATAVGLGRLGHVAIAPDGDSARPREAAVPPSATSASNALAWSDATPAAPGTAVAPGAKAAFSARATGGSASVTYQWLLDGKPQADGAAWSFVPVDSDAGTSRKITVVASAGGQHIERSWQLRVGRLPTIASASPGEPVASATAGSAVQFSVAATDPDGGALSFRWERNGKQIERADGAAITVPDVHDRDEIRVVVASAAGGTATHAWRVETRPDAPPSSVPPGVVTSTVPPSAAPPRIVAQVPAAGRPVQVREGSSVDFTVRLAQPAPGPVRHTWYLDGQEVSGDPALSYRPSQLPSDAPAAHRIEVAVASVPEGETARVGWNVQVLPTAPTIAGAYPKNEAVSVAAGGRQEFTVSTPPHPAGDGSLVFEWTVDGRSAQRGEQGQFAFEGDSGGHVVEVVAIDGRGVRSKSRRWRVEVAGAPAEAAVAPKSETVATQRVTGAPPASPAAEARVTEAGAREWLAQYQAAMEKRDVDALQRLGAARDAAHAKRLEENLARLPLVGLRTERVTVEPDGQHATVVFRRTHRSGDETSETGVVVCRLGKGAGGLVAAGACSSEER